jgi:hypothetical protein
MKEIYEDIKEWPDYYISNKGSVLKDTGVKESKVAICPNKKRNNYCYVYHSNYNMRPRALSVHRLVARYFIPNPENKPCVNHIDNDTQNNSIENLEWVTHQENIDHMVKQGRHRSVKGEDHASSVLTEKTVRLIKKEIRTMTYMELAKKHNTNYSNIAHIKRGSRWGHVKVD